MPYGLLFIERGAGEGQVRGLAFLQRHRTGRDGLERWHHRLNETDPSVRRGGRGARVTCIALAHQRHRPTFHFPMGLACSAVQDLGSEQPLLLPPDCSDRVTQRTVPEVFRQHQHDVHRHRKFQLVSYSAFATPVSSSQPFERRPRAKHGLLLKSTQACSRPARGLSPSASCTGPSC